MLPLYSHSLLVSALLYFTVLSADIYMIYEAFLSKLTGMETKPTRKYVLK